MREFFERILPVISLLLFLWIVFSVMALMPDKSTDHDSGLTASELETQESVNGNVTSTSYVDSDGRIRDAIDVGYATVRRTRNADGEITEEVYLDADGNLVRRYDDYFGCVDNILNGFPYMVVVFGCMICLLILFLPRNAGLFLTVAYVFFIFYETLMFRETGNERINFILFSYADRFFTEQSVRIGVVDNIWLFIPLGTGLYRFIRKKWILLIPVLFSVIIETTQYFTGLGIAELDDVFGNTLGGWLGMMMVYVAYNQRRQKELRALE